MRLRFASLALIALTLQPESLLAATPQQSTRPLTYSVRFDAASAHYADIELTIPSPPRGTVQVMMPVWTPGSYLVREYSRNIEQITALDVEGRTLPLEKLTKNIWQIACDPGSDVTVRYRLYCHELSVRTNWVDSDMAVLNGAATYLTVPEWRNRPHQVEFQLPDNWPDVQTALQRTDSETWTFQATTLDELVDSPVLCGQIDVTDFKAGGVPHTIAHIGDVSLWDTEAVAADVKKIVLAQQEFWGTTPYPHYVFLNVITEGRGGLEHDNSTLVMTSRWNYRDPDKYRDWLSLISHEFFHTWNVRRLRPEGLGTYDFNRENYTRGLWVAEGITSYYQNIFLARAGLIDQAEYLKRMSKSIDTLQKTPGRTVQSLTDSSFDAWVKFYRPDENSSNSRVSYYTKGAVVAFLLDARIRELTDGRKCLDDVMRLLYQRFAGQAEFTDADFGKIVNEVAGSDLTEWLVHHVYSAEELDYQPALNWYGLQFPDPDAANEDEDDGDKDASDAATEESKPDASEHSEDAKKDEPPKKPEPWLGIKTSTSGKSISVSSVQHGSPAHAAGLNVNDELLAFNQYRVDSGKWSDQLKQIGVGESVDVLISRRGEIRTIPVQIAVKPKQKWTLKPVNEPTADQKARLNDLLDAGQSDTTSKDDPS